MTYDNSFNATDRTQSPSDRQSNSHLNLSTLAGSDGFSSMRATPNTADAYLPTLSLSGAGGTELPAGAINSQTSEVAPAPTAAPESLTGSPAPPAIDSPTVIGASPVETLSAAPATVDSTAGAANLPGESTTATGQPATTPQALEAQIAAIQLQIASTEAGISTLLQDALQGAQAPGSSDQLANLLNGTFPSSITGDTAGSTPAAGDASQSQASGAGTGGPAGAEMASGPGSNVGSSGTSAESTGNAGGGGQRWQHKDHGRHRHSETDQPGAEGGNGLASSQQQPGAEGGNGPASSLQQPGADSTPGTVAAQTQPEVTGTVAAQTQPEVTGTVAAQTQPEVTSTVTTPQTQPEVSTVTTPQTVTPNPNTTVTAANNSSGFQIANGQLTINGQLLEGVAVTGEEAQQVGATALAAEIKNDFPGINSVRLATSPDGGAFTEGQPLQGGESVNDIQQVINAFNAQGIGVIVDNHGSDANTPNNVAQDAANGEASWFGQLAANNVGNNMVMFQTENEPTGTDAAVAGEQQAAYNSIRNAGFTGVVAFDEEGGGDPSNFENNLSTYAGMSNYVIDAHAYAANSSNPVADVQSEVAATSNVLEANGSVAPVYIGETGNSIDGSDLDANATPLMNYVAQTYGAEFWLFDGAATGYGSGNGADMMTNSDGSLDSYGQQIAGIIAQNTGTATS